MPSKLRLQRISGRIHEELSEMLLFEIHDPRLDEITVTDVKVDRELAYANIYVSAIEGIERSQEIIRGLNHAKGFIRSTLSRRIHLRSFPNLRFHWDPTPEQANHIENLLNSIKTDESVNENDIDANE